jgi:hypothetical protein
MGLVVQPYMCLAWASYGLPFGFTLLVGLCCLNDNIKILGIPFGFDYFSLSFLQKALNENVHHVDELLRLRDVHIAFGILF